MVAIQNIQGHWRSSARPSDDIVNDVPHITVSCKCTISIMHDSKVLLGVANVHVDAVVLYKDTYKHTAVLSRCPRASMHIFQLMPLRVDCGAHLLGSKVTETSISSPSHQ